MNSDVQKDVAQNELLLASKHFPVGIYYHHKGGEYCVYSMSIHESLLVPLIHYYSLLKKIRWTRTLGDWSQTVEKDGHLIPRYKFSRKASKEELTEACGLVD